jgi:hypothetical protein
VQEKTGDSIFLALQNSEATFGGGTRKKKEIGEKILF